MAGGNGILTFVEVNNGKLTPVAKEIIGVARILADAKSWKVTSVIIGDKVSVLADELLKFGADKVFVCESPLLANFVDES
ncbi:MAG TPA: electron transporter, partial [candidate division Zixibacteria bacterium]|nr:electron transporter [candidate division Zixibacteria bacterium]